jgi:hypothetical protein
LIDAFRQRAHARASANSPAKEISMQGRTQACSRGGRESPAIFMTVRVAIDTLANVLAEGLEEQDGRALTEVYIASLSRIQSLLESREPRQQ